MVPNIDTTKHTHLRHSQFGRSIPYYFPVSASRQRNLMQQDKQLELKSYQLYNAGLTTCGLKVGELRHSESPVHLRS